MATGPSRPRKGASAMIRAAAQGALAALLLGAAGTATALDPALQPSQYVRENWQIGGGPAADLGAGDRADAGRLPLDRHAGGTRPLRRRALRRVRRWCRVGAAGQAGRCAARRPCRTALGRHARRPRGTRGRALPHRRRRCRARPRVHPRHRRGCGRPAVGRDREWQGPGRDRPRSTSACSAQRAGCATRPSARCCRTTAARSGSRRRPPACTASTARPSCRCRCRPAPTAPSTQ